MKVPWGEIRTHDLRPVGRALSPSNAAFGGDRATAWRAQSNMQAGGL